MLELSRSLGYRVVVLASYAACCTPQGCVPRGVSRHDRADARRRTVKTALYVLLCCFQLVAARS